MTEILLGLIPVLLAFGWRLSYDAGRAAHQREIDRRVREMLLRDIKITESDGTDPYEQEVRHNWYQNHDWRAGFAITGVTS